LVSAASDFGGRPRLRPEVPEVPEVVAVIVNASW
jgi:hypothetical protein